MVSCTLKWLVSLAHTIAAKMALNLRMRRIFYDWLRRLYVCCGHNIFQPGGFEIGALTVAVYLQFLLFTICLFYTFFAYDWFVKLNVATLIGIACEVIFTIFLVEQVNL